MAVASFRVFPSLPGSYYPHRRRANLPSPPVRVCKGMSSAGNTKRVVGAGSNLKLLDSCQRMLITKTELRSLRAGEVPTGCKRNGELFGKATKSSKSGK